MMKINKWQDIKFTIELVGLSKKYLDFLEYMNVSCAELIDDGSEKLIEKAVFRYENYWLPFFFNSIVKNRMKLEIFYPPNDIAWVWHCHLLSPTDYSKDCKAVYGEKIDHYCFNQEEICINQNNTRPLWESELNVPFEDSDLNSTDFVTSKNVSNFSYDIKGACQREKNFCYQVSLPHFQNDNYLEECLNRYKKFLYLKINNQDLDLVPCYGIELMWRTHIMNPLAYAYDMLSQLRYLLPHDDRNWPNDRSTATVCSDLWRTTFGEEFFRRGAMYRGEKPKRDLFFLNEQVDFRSYFLREGFFRLVKCSIRSEDESQSKERSKFLLKINRSGQTLLAGLLDEKSPLISDDQFKFSELDESSLKLAGVISCKETVLEKFVNLFQTSKQVVLSHQQWFDQTFDTRSDQTNQELTVKIADTKGVKHFLTLKWLLIKHIKPYIVFNLHRKSFRTVKIAQIIEDYGAFNLKSINPEHEGFIARHTLLDQLRLEHFKIEILHVMSPAWLSIKLTTQRKKLMTTLHLLNQSELPTYESDSFTYNADTDRALLIRNYHGDYAILKGEWDTERKSILVTVYSCASKQSSSFEVGSDLSVELNYEMIRSTFNLNFSKINMNFEMMDDERLEGLQVANMITLIFGTAALYDLLRSFHVNLNNNNSNSDKLKKKHKHSPYWMSFVSSIGYSDLLAMNSSSEVLNEYSPYIALQESIISTNSSLPKLNNLDLETNKENTTNDPESIDDNPTINLTTDNQTTQSTDDFFPGQISF